MSESARPSGQSPVDLLRHVVKYFKDLHEDGVIEESDEISDLLQRLTGMVALHEPGEALDQSDYEFAQSVDKNVSALLRSRSKELSEKGNHLQNALDEIETKIEQLNSSRPTYDPRVKSKAEKARTQLTKERRELADLNAKLKDLEDEIAGVKTQIAAKDPIIKALELSASAGQNGKAGQGERKELQKAEEVKTKLELDSSSWRKSQLSRDTASEQWRRFMESLVRPASHRTFLIHDPICFKHKTVGNAYDTEGRLRVAVQVMKTAHHDHGQAVIYQECAQRDTVDKIETQIGKCHSTDYIAKMKQRCEDAGDDVAHLSDGESGDTYGVKDSYEATRRSCACVVEAIKAVWDGKVKSAFVAARPPGHHAAFAGRSAGAPSQGFCIFNNVAVGCLYATEELGVSKVAVFDFDVHHGNGTEDILQPEGKETEKYLYISVHAHGITKAGAPIFPSTGEARDDKYVLSIPFEQKMVEAPFLAQEDGVLTRIEKKLADFGPDLIILSAGFDGHIDDPLGLGEWTALTYYTLTKRIQDLADRICNGRVVSVLEGGYGPEVKQNRAERNIRESHYGRGYEGSIREHLYAMMGIPSEVAITVEQEDDDGDDKCAICLDAYWSDRNKIIYCDGCNVAVHQCCYGVKLIPKLSWFCYRCIEKNRNLPQCSICDHRTKRVQAFWPAGSNKEKEWVHSICAIHLFGAGIPERKDKPLIYLKSGTMKWPATGHTRRYSKIMSKLPASKYCSGCGGKTGYAHKCMGGCNRYYHPMCTVTNFLEFDLDRKGYVCPECAHAATQEKARKLSTAQGYREESMAIDGSSEQAGKRESSSSGSRGQPPKKLKLSFKPRPSVATATGNGVGGTENTTSVVLSQEEKARKAAYTRKDETEKTVDDYLRKSPVNEHYRKNLNFHFDVAKTRRRHEYVFNVEFYCHDCDLELEGNFDTIVRHIMLKHSSPRTSTYGRPPAPPNPILSSGAPPRRPAPPGPIDKGVKPAPPGPLRPTNSSNAVPGPTASLAPSDTVRAQSHSLVGNSGGPAPASAPASFAPSSAPESKPKPEPVTFVDRLETQRFIDKCKEKFMNWKSVAPGYKFLQDNLDFTFQITPATDGAKFTPKFHCLRCNDTTPLVNDDTPTKHMLDRHPSRPAISPEPNP
eukprot:Clim_evm4s40 gene=Clim_evmTU4s40